MEHIHMPAFFWDSPHGLHRVLNALGSGGFYVAKRSGSSGSDIQPRK